MKSNTEYLTFEVPSRIDFRSLLPDPNLLVSPDRITLFRPVFEAMGKGKPGLVISSIRALLLSAPFAWSGMRVAEIVNQPPIYGLIIGLQIVTVLTSAVFSL